MDAPRHDVRTTAVGQDLAALLRSLRPRALLTPEQLAEHAGLSIGTIRGIERGRIRHPRRTSVRLLADALGLGPPERQTLIAAATDDAEVGVAVDRVVPVPAQLPADVAGFTGRDGCLAELDALLLDNDTTPRPVPISVIAGSPGVGKTALAVHWAHRVAERFPDGQLYIDLRGYADQPPLRPIDALARFLRALGVPPERMPTEPDELAAYYRSSLAERRLLVLLDNAAESAQVRPLLPGRSACVVVVTSRDQLGELIARDGGRTIRLDPLPPDQSVELLIRLLGVERVTAEPTAATELADLCAHLPLALRIAAANLAGRPARSIADHVQCLREDDRFGGLTLTGDDQSAVAAAFELSYVRLPKRARQLFRSLSIVPSTDVTANTAAALSDGTSDAAGRLLTTLVAAHLVAEHTPGRYVMHDLLRHYAGSRAERDMSAVDRQAARNRLYDYFLGNTDAAAELLYPEVSRLPVQLSPEPRVVDFDDAAGAQAWLDAEWSNLVAAIQHASVRGPLEMAWRLADCLRGFCWLRRHLTDWETVGRAALAAAAGEQNPRAEAAARLGLGDLHFATGRYPPAVEHYTAALELSRRADWIAGQASARSNLGLVHWERGRLDEAVDHLEQALALQRRAGRQAGEAGVLAKLGLIYRNRGQLRRAAERLTRAAALHHRVGARGGEAHAIGNLGDVLHALGQPDRAREHLARSLALYRELGDGYGEANVYLALAAVERDTSHGDAALEHAAAGLELADELDDPRTVTEALDTLGSIQLRLDHPRQAVDHHQQALELARLSGADLQYASALVGLASANLRLGQSDQALDRAQQALGCARRADHRPLQGRALTVLAEISLSRGEVTRATDYAQQALDNYRDTEHNPDRTRARLVLRYAERGVGGAPR